MKPFIFLSCLILLISCDSNKNSSTTETSETQQIDTLITDSTTTQPETSEEFEDVDIQEINAQISEETADLVPQEIMRIYYPYEAGEEGNEEFTISEEELANGNTQVTLIHDNLMDDSMRGVKEIMELRQVDGRWQVVSIKRNWKCWENRGHADWGIELCF